MRAGGCAGSGESICRPDGGASPVPATTTHFVVSDFTLQGAEPLIRYMLGQPFEVEPPIGRLPILEAREPGIGEPVAPLRVFLSHTAELDEHQGGRFVCRSGPTGGDPGREPLRGRDFTTAAGRNGRSRLAGRSSK